MGVERQQSRAYQLSLFEGEEGVVRHGVPGEGGTGTAACEEQQRPTASERERALPEALPEALMPEEVVEEVLEVVEPGNLNRGYQRVKANKGAPGVDGMTVDDLGGWLAEHREELMASLLAGSYQPKPVRGVEIPKLGGGVRELGIPTVVDRLVQQAILQVLNPLLDPTLSERSYGFRPGRNAHQALRQAQKYVAEGREIVVDLDLERFFDRVNHDILMSRLARRVADKRLLRMVRRYLEAGMMRNGVCVERHEGTPQGGPLSPLLSNLLLDDLDKELERRGHRFCRYADPDHIGATYTCGPRRRGSG